MDNATRFYSSNYKLQFRGRSSGENESQDCRSHSLLQDWSTKANLTQTGERDLLVSYTNVRRVLQGKGKLKDALDDTRKCPGG
jgi:hypothetical protein